MTEIYTVNFHDQILTIKYIDGKWVSRESELEREVEKLKSTLVETKNKIIEAELQNNDRCWFNVEIILRQTIDSINEVLK